MVSAIGRSGGVRMERSASNSSAQIAALQKQLVEMQKQIAELAGGEKTKASQQQMELLSQMMVVVQAQIAALQAADAQNNQLQALAAAAEEAGGTANATVPSPLAPKASRLLDVLA